MNSDQSYRSGGSAMGSQVTQDIQTAKEQLTLRHLI